MQYITEDRYRALGTGVDLTGKSSTEINAILEAASYAVNAAVGAPEGYSFLGGTVLDEAHQWRVASRAPKPTDGRIWPFNKPVRSVSAVRVYATSTQHLDFDSTQLFLQGDMGYVEPVATPSTTALYTALPPWLLTSPIAYIDYEYGFDLSVTDERMATESGGSLRAGHQFWFTEEEVVLKKNGVIVPSVDYTVDYDEGTITPVTPDETATWKASYHFKLPPGVAAATALIASDLFGAGRIAAAGMLGLSGIKVEEVELRQSSKVNFFVNPINAAAQIYLAPYAAMFTSMR